MFRFLFLSSLVLIPIHFNLSQPVLKELDTFINEYYKVKNIPSISAGASRNGKIIWLSAKGYADLENLVPATPKTVYRIASVSKPITAVAIMQLVEKGKINLDADARNYIPYFPAMKWKFTTRQLLSHTSGFRDYRPGEYNSKENFRTTKDVVNYLAKDSLISEPGSNYVYSTLAYNLLAAIVENVSGESFSDYLKKNIFDPAEMNSTLLEVQKQIVLNRARGYTKDEHRQIINAPLADLSIKYPGGGLISTAEDILKFSNALIQGKLVKSKTLDSMLVPTKLKSGKNINYGLGFGFGTDPRGKTYYTHTGGGTGFLSHLIVYPSEKIAAVHLINVRDRNLENPAWTITEIILNEKYTLPKRSAADYLVTISENSSIDSVITVCKKLKTSPSEYEVSEDELCLFGSDLIAMNRKPDAIKFFKYVLDEYPRSIKGFTGLADAYYKDGNIGMAINSYRLALRIDPMNTYADQMIRKLNGNKN